MYLLEIELHYDHFVPYGSRYIMTISYHIEIEYTMTNSFHIEIHNEDYTMTMFMVQNTYGTKWFLVMVRNCNFVVRNGKLWYEMVSGYGTKLQFCGTKW
jgi:hypothetical protein